MNLSGIGLDRFVEAQHRVYDRVLDELAMGHKTSHWMWFIFPQLKELGRSPIAKHFGIESRNEALAFMDHPVLGKRLIECVKLLNMQPNADGHDIFGTPDDLKLRSCLTLFSEVSQEPCFAQALERFFDGKKDKVTLGLLMKN
jgi:uncharacterized protein (DUF1810 family)